MDVNGGCFQKEELFAYAHGLLEPAQEDRIRPHLEQCEACRTVVGKYQRMEALLNEWRAEEPLPRVKRPAVAGPVKRRSSHVGIRLSQVWPPALLCLVVVAGFLVTGRVRRAFEPGRNLAIVSEKKPPQPMQATGKSGVERVPVAPAQTGAAPIEPVPPSQPAARNLAEEVQEGKTAEPLAAPEKTSAGQSGKAGLASGGVGKDNRANQPALTSADDDMLSSFDILLELPQAKRGGKRVVE